MTTPSLAPGTVIADRFVIESLAGTGGMGSVFRARDMAAGQTVALKLMQASTDPMRERLLHQVPEHARVLELARERWGEDAGTSAR